MSGINSDSQLDFAVRFGGEGGEGVISAGELFAQVAARTKYNVLTYITYPAEIRGGFSMIQIRVRDCSIHSMGSKVDYLVVFNQQAYDRTIKDIKEGGMLIYDPETVNVDKNIQASFHPIRLTEITHEITGGNLGKNVVALGAMGNLFKIEKNILEKLVHDRYASKGDKVVENNLKLLNAGYDEGIKNDWERKFNLKSSGDGKSNYMMVSGNEAVALGALAAGCRFVAGYPITPATPIFETLTQLMPKVGGRAIQLEDEIASISACIGASFAGEKAISPTSGPGLQLMGEQLNLASMLELPIVIVDVQRGGPSTGLPTKTEQSDLKFALYGTTGEAPRIVLAPSSVEDCFYQTIRAFNLAEKYQMPVLLLTDQSLGYMKATVRTPDLSNIIEIDATFPVEKLSIPNSEIVYIVKRLSVNEKDLGGYKRFLDTVDGISPITKPGISGGQYLASGLEHREDGKADYTPAIHEQMLEKRFKKISTLAKSLENNPVEWEGPEEAEIGVIGWGSTHGAIHEARLKAAGEGIIFKHLHPKVLSPLPENQIKQFLAGLKQVFVVEENYTAQFAHYLKGKFDIKPIEIKKYQGLPFTPDEIYNGIIKAVRQIK